MDYHGGSFLSQRQFFVWIDRYADRCRITGTVFDLEWEGWVPAAVIDRSLNFANGTN